MSRAMRGRAGAAAALVALCGCRAALPPRAGSPAAGAPSWQAAASSRYAGIEAGPIELSEGRYEGEP